MASLHDAINNHVRVTQAINIHNASATVPNIANIVLKSKTEVDVQTFNLTKSVPKHLENNKDIANWFIDTKHLCPEVVISYFIDHMDIFEAWCVIICGANLNDMDFSNSVLLFLRKFYTMEIIEIISESDFKNMVSRFAYKLYETHGRGGRRSFAAANAGDTSIMSLLKSIMDKKLFGELVFMLLSTNKSKIDQIMMALTILEEHREGHEDFENIPSKHLSEFLVFYRSYDASSKLSSNNSSGNGNGSSNVVNNVNDMNIVIDLYHILMNILQTYYQEEEKLIYARANNDGLISDGGGGFQSYLFYNDILLHKCWKVELFKSNETRRLYYCVLTSDAIYLLLQHQVTDNSAMNVVRKGTYYVDKCIPLAVSAVVAYSMSSFEVFYTGKLNDVLDASTSYLPQSANGIPVVSYHPVTKQVVGVDYTSRLVFELTSIKAPPSGSSRTAATAGNAGNLHTPYCCGAFEVDESDDESGAAAGVAEGTVGIDGSGGSDVVMDWSDKVEELVQYNMFLRKEASASASDYGYQNQNEDPNQNYQPFSTGSAAHTNSTNTRTAGILQPGKSNLRASTGVHTGVGIGGNTAAANGHVMLGSQVNSILTLKSPTAGASAPTATTNNRVKFNDYAIQEDHDLL